MIFKISRKMKRKVYSSALFLTKPNVMGSAEMQE